MATVYRWVRGMPIQRAMAVTQETQDELERQAKKIEARAKILLAAHKDRGDAQIEVSQGKVDHFVSLDDSRGYGAAMSMEFGHDSFVLPNGNVIPAMEGLYILHQAANLPRKRR